MRKEEQNHFRIGLSVSKKIGNAVMRNQIKRYIRQAFLELEEEIKPQYDLIVIARKPVAEMDFHEVKKSLIHVLKVSRVLNKPRLGNTKNQ
ncbi:ribonuclease P [Bacillus sp. 2_A_57_CT2]|nr:ribonuclease P [Bacillus sp. 2_A_57_CT2]